MKKKELKARIKELENFTAELSRDIITLISKPDSQDSKFIKACRDFQNGTKWEDLPDGKYKNDDPVMSEGLQELIDMQRKENAEIWDNCSKEALANFEANEKKINEAYTKLQLGEITLLEYLEVHGISRGSEIIPMPSDNQPLS